VGENDPENVSDMVSVMDRLLTDGINSVMVSVLVTVGTSVTDEDHDPVMLIESVPVCSSEILGDELPVMDNSSVMEKDCVFISVLLRVEEYSNVIVSDMVFSMVKDTEGDSELVISWESVILICCDGVSEEDCSGDTEKVCVLLVDSDFEAC